MTDFFFKLNAKITVVTENHCVSLSSLQITPNSMFAITTGADSAGTSGNFAPVLTEKPWQTLCFVLISFRGLFWFLNWKCNIALIAFRINWLIPIISHFKMLDDGTVLFIENNKYTYSLYAWTMIFFYWCALTVHLNFAPVCQTQCRLLWQ